MEESPSEVIELEANDEAESAPEIDKEDVDVIVIVKKRSKKTHFSFSITGYDRKLVEHKLNDAVKKTTKGAKNCKPVLAPTYKEMDEGNIVQGIAVLVSEE